MKINGRKTYKAGPRDECSSPSYCVIPLVPHIERYRKKIGIPKGEFVILEPATGMGEKLHTGIVDGFSRFGYPVVALRDYDFTTLDIDFVTKRYNHYGKIRMIVTNPPFSVSLKRKFINRCKQIYEHYDIPFALLMSATTLVEKINGKTLRGCAVHVPKGRICYGMPNKGWGTEDNPTTATFETMWYSMGLTGPYSISYDNFNMSNHFSAMKRFNNMASDMDGLIYTF